MNSPAETPPHRLSGVSILKCPACSHWIAAMSDGFCARLAQGIGLGLAAPFGHGFGKISKQDSETKARS